MGAVEASAEAADVRFCVSVAVACSRCRSWRRCGRRCGSAALPNGAERRGYGGLRITRCPLEKLAVVASIQLSGRVSTGVKTAENFEIRAAGVDDVPVILELIRDLAIYER